LAQVSGLRPRRRRVRSELADIDLQRGGGAVTDREQLRSGEANKTIRDAPRPCCYRSSGRSATIPTRHQLPDQIGDLAMRSLIAGTDDTGRSCIVTELPIKDYDVHRSGPSARIDVFKLAETPAPAPLSTRAAYHDTGLAPGHMDVCVLQMPASIEHRYHYTDTLNLHVIVAGSVEVLLDDGPHQLDMGDSLVLPPVDHGWRAGPNGCTQTIMNLGTARRP
jgi:hypothetical protein